MASDPDRSTDRIRAELYEAAATFQPDRAIILARVRAGQAGSDPSIGRRPRYHGRAATAASIAASVAATVAAVLGVGVAVNGAAVRNETTLQPATTPTTDVSPRPTTVVSPRPTTGPTVARTAPTHSPKGRPPSHAHPSPPTVSPSSTLSRQGFLSSAGAVDQHSIDNWSQSNVTLRTDAIVTALQIRVRIARTPDLTPTGAWSTLLPDEFTTTVNQQPDALVYTLVLKPGASMSPGEYTFAVQYNHATGGRDASGDTYQATAASGGTSVAVAGGF